MTPEDWLESQDLETRRMVRKLIDIALKEERERVSDYMAKMEERFPAHYVECDSLDPLDIAYCEGYNDKAEELDDFLMNEFTGFNEKFDEENEI